MSCTGKTSKLLRIYELLNILEEAGGDQRLAIPTMASSMHEIDFTLTLLQYRRDQLDRSAMVEGLILILSLSQAEKNPDPEK